MSPDVGLFGPYRLDELLGRGGMGEVYRAYDTEHQRNVAIKLLAAHLADDDEFKVRFRREAFSAARLSSPHIVPIHRYGEIDDRLYIDMRLVEGGDLGELVRTAGPLDLDRAVGIIEQVASALEDAHRNGLVHRDVKPSNVLLDGHVADFCYLADFGVTRLATSLTSNSLTRTGAILGSLAYMSPEQFDGAVTPRSDIYSLACVLFEILTGRKPYVGEGLPALMHAHMQVPPPRPSSHNPSAAPLDDVIAKGMAKNADARFASAGELARAARAALDTNRRQETVADEASLSPPTDEFPFDLTDHVTVPPAPPSTTVPRAAAPAAIALPPSASDTAAVQARGRARRWAAPLAAAVAIIAVLTGAVALASNGTAVAGRPLPQAAPPPATASATPAPVAGPASGPTLVEAIFTGRTSDNEMTIAVGIKDGRAAGYVCDGKRAEAWLEGTISGTKLVLHGRDPSTSVTADVDQRSALGTVTFGGSTRPFSAQIAAGASGLYQSKRTVQGIATRIGWIVLPDGTQVGIRRQGDTLTSAPPLDTATSQAVDDGRPVHADRVDGASTVLG